MTQLPNKGYDNRLEDVLQIDAVRTALREALFERLACPRCSGDLYLCPWAYERQQWQCLTPACNFTAADRPKRK
jgi:hypothetical protein